MWAVGSARSYLETFVLPLDLEQGQEDLVKTFKDQNPMEKKSRGGIRVPRITEEKRRSTLRKLQTAKPAKFNNR